VLRGAENIRWSGDEAREAINYFIKTGKLKKSKNPLWRGKIIQVR
jgi:hypothetical protein